MQQSRAERYLSPLRYPGGKASIAPMLGDMFAGQMSDMPIEIWIEPFAGGAGAALGLVERDAVDEAWLVDANPAIAAFWATVLADGERLATQVERTVPTMRLWEDSRALLEAGDGVGTYELAFAAFIVNRCSRSGIVAPRSGPIGGRAQDGRWTISSRFNGCALADRIRRVHALRSRLRSHHADGIRFIEDVDESGICDEVVFFVDPPYLREGNRLYAHGMDRAAHQRLATALNGTAARWLLTYDNHPDVAGALYPERRVIPFGIRNTANQARQATELAVLSDNLEASAFNLPKVPVGGGLPATA
ncbi:hypothetical protein [Microbacterium paraoxydans]|uniref:hypothetical protein n=1 Tax=Microbacterium paraoxydans TaxID=199592 RepID=UPI0021A3EEE8|nr:hypothetical protein [Microbacterium paraoxydans]MCT2225018.1 hypothetical protein [Microbacterium paraoxydans]